MASRRRAHRVNGRLTDTHNKHHTPPTPLPPATPPSYQSSTSQSSNRLYPLPPPYGRATSSSSFVASSISSITVADEEDDEVSELLNGTQPLHPSAPTTPQRATLSTRHHSSPLTLSHFDHSPIRHSATHRSPSSPVPFPAPLTASLSSSHSASLLLSALEQWRLQLLRAAFHDWLQHSGRRGLLHSAFEHWRQHKTYAKLDRTKTLHALQHWSHTHQHTAFHHWHNVTTRPHRATQLYQARLTRRLFGAWVGWVGRRKRLYETAHMVVDRGEERVRREVMGWWLGQVRQRLVADGLQVKRAATRAIDRWRQRVAAERRKRWQVVQMEQLKADWDKSRAREAVALWRSFVSQQRQRRLHAQLADCHYQRRTMRLWRQQVPAEDEEKMMQKYQRASRFRSMRLQKRVLTAWHNSSMLAQQQGEWLLGQEDNRRKSHALHGWLSLWQDAVVHRAEQERVAADWQSQRSMSVFSSLFSHWLHLTRLFILDRQRLSAASELQRSSSLFSSLSTWFWFSRRRRRVRALVERADDECSRRLLTSAWVLWFTTYRRSHAIERVQGVMRRRLLDSAFGGWRDAVLDKRIAAGQQQRQQRTLRIALLGWQRTTRRMAQLAAAVTHFRATDSQRYQRVTLTHWRTFYLIHHQRRLWLLRITFQGLQQELEEKREQRALLRHVVVQWRTEAVRFKQQRLLSLRLYRQHLLLPAIAALQQHAQWKRSQREKAQLASSHYHRTTASHSHHSRYLRTAYLAWYYYTRHRRQLLMLSDTLQQRQARLVLLSALSVWHQQTEQLRLADEWRRRYAQAQAVNEWRHWTAQRAEDEQLTDVLQRLWQQKQQERVRGALQCWYEWCCERRVDSAQQRLARLFHLRQLMVGWKRCVPADVKQRMKAKQEAATRLSEQLVVKRVWRAWKMAQVRRKQDGLQVAVEWQSRQKNKRLRAVWADWKHRLALVSQWNTTAEQRLQTKRSVHLASLYGQWRRAFKQRREDNRSSVAAERHHRMLTLRWSCRRWRAVNNYSQRRRSVLCQLISSQHVHVLRAAMATWLQHTRLSHAAAVLSDYAAQLHVQAAYLQWSELLLSERAEEWHRQRQQLRLSTSLTVWRDNSHTFQQQRQRLEQMRQLVATHRVSASFHAWTALTQRRRQLLSQSSSVAALHNRHMLRATLRAWLQQRRVHQQMRLHVLRRAFMAWRVERRKRNVERKQLKVVLQEWKGAAKRERAMETASRHLLHVRTMRSVMGAWQSSRLAQHVFAHWRQRAADIVLLSSQLQIGAAHYQRRQKQLAVNSLLDHTHRSHNVALLKQHLNLAHHTHLLRLALSVWLQRWREAHAVSGMAALLARQQQTAAWQRWQEAVWDERVQRFQQRWLMTQAANAVHRWTANYRQHQHETALITQCQVITARSLLSVAFHHLTACYQVTRHARHLEEAAASQYTGRVSREVFAWWYNVSIIRRHMRTTRRRGIWQVWRQRVAESIEQRAAVVRAFHSWRDAATYGKQCMQRAVSAYRQRHLTTALATLSTFARAKAVYRTMNERAEQRDHGQLLQHTWSLWRQRQHFAMAYRAQLDLAARYSASSTCARAVTRWRDWRLERQQRVDVNVAAVQTLENSMGRRAVRRWRRTAQQHRSVRSVQQLTLRPVMQEWRLTTAAVRADRRQLLQQALVQWTAARHEREQERKVQQARQRRAQRAYSRIMQAWTALSGTHVAVRLAGERLKEARRLRQLRDVFDMLRTIASTASTHSQRQEAAAVSFDCQHRLHRLLVGWQHLAATEHAKHAEWDARAEKHWTITAQRRVLDAWEERMSAVLRLRHIAASQSVRLSIALRSYHTSLLLHTFSVWRAAYLAVHYSHSSHRSSSAATSDSPPPRLSSMRDLRAYIEQVRGTGRPGLTIAPRSPLSAATTETGSYAPSEASRPSTNGSVHEEQEERSIVTAAKRAFGGLSRGDRISRIDMRDL